ncbi:MAG: universal stress protein [Paludibacteraceae bacterium]|nr:universal stress protein [Paludibacteraceae bacterium]
MTSENSNILVPIDFTDHSFKAAIVAIHMAKRLAASQVTLFHALSNNEANLANQLIEFNDKLRKALENSELAGIKTSFQLAVGVPEECIKTFAMQNPPCLIVMATRSKVQKQKDMIGSVCAEFIERTEWPVLVVPAEIPVKRVLKPLKVAYATSFSQRDISELDDMMRILKYWTDSIDKSLSVSFVHIKSDLDSETLQSRIDSLKSYMQLSFPDLDFSIHILDKHEERTIDLRLLEDGTALFNTLQNFIKTYGIDLLTIKNSKRGLFSRMFVGSTATKIINEGDISLLVL